MVPMVCVGEDVGDEDRVGGGGGGAPCALRLMWLLRMDPLGDLWK